MRMIARNKAAQPTVALAPAAHWANRLDRRVLIPLTVAGFALPVFAYLWFMHHYAINTIVGDQFDDLTVIHQSYLHGFDWGSLWAQHNENRIFFPNLIVIFLARTTHFNVKIEEYLSAVMLVTAMTLLVLALRRRAPTIPMLYYCPVFALGFSFVQWSNTTWGFQMAWYLVLLTLVVAIYLLDRPRLTWLIFGAAVVTAVVGSFSSSQGLLIWPAGLILLYHRKRPFPYVAAWIGLALVTAVAYLYHLQSAGPSPRLVLDAPLAALKMYLFALGDIVGFQVNFGQRGNIGVLALGAVIFIVAIAVLILYGLNRDFRGGNPIGLSLICVGLLFDALITEGRLIFGYVGASGSRYTTMDLLVPIGIYLTLLDRSPRIRPPTPGVARPTFAMHSDHRLRWLPVTMSRWADRYVLLAARAVILAIILVQVAIGLPNGLHGARSNYVYQAKGAHVLLTINHQNDGAVVQYLYVFRSAPWIRRQVRILAHYHLSLFAPGAGSSPRAQGRLARPAGFSIDGDHP
jgi:hypothetical protein